MNYRADIDGLRALAVVPVVFYHAGIPGFSGGYVGVDVFFVISGFLIARLIWPQIEAGTFSLRTFYARRARRILPALFTVAAVSFLVGLVLLVPADLDDLSASLVATVLFSANLYFWHETDYFAVEAELRPLLHVWSLGVEEQFYIAFPALLLWLAKGRAQHARVVLATLVLVSLLLSAATLIPFPQATFFALTQRAWELLLGAAIGMRLLPQAPRGLADLAAGCGICLIVCSIVLFNQETPFPGPIALLPCLGAALVVWAGDWHGGRKSSGGENVRPLLVASWLSFTPLVGLGLISYSLYLWHWPVLVYLQYWLDRPLAGGELPGALGLTLLLAVVSWHRIEQPFRRTNVLSRLGPLRPQIQLRLAMASGAVLIAAGLIGALSDGLPQRLSPAARAFAEVERDRSSGRCKFNLMTERLEQKDFCLIGTPGTGAPDFIVWGDSHASAALPALRAAAQSTGAWGLLIWQPGCPPLLGVSKPREADGPDCLRFNVLVETYLNARAVANLILIARWNQTLLGRPMRDVANRRPEIYVTDAASAEISLAENKASMQRGLERTFSSIYGANATMGGSRRQIWFMYQMPFPGFEVPRHLVHLAMRGDSSPDRWAQFAEGVERQNRVRDLIDPILRRHDVRAIEPWPALCEGARCQIAKAGRSLYRDEDHISATAAEFIAPAFEQALQPVK